MRILIIEDELLIAMALADELADAGHEVVGIASTFAAAVDLAERERPYIAIADVRLAQGCDGIDLAIHLRERFGIRSLIASGSIDNAAMERGRRADPLGWIAKPYCPARMLAALATASVAGGAA